MKFNNTKPPPPSPKPLSVVLTEPLLNRTKSFDQKTRGIPSESTTEREGFHDLNPEAPPVRRAKPLKLWAVVALIFYSVSGGPFGTEDAVAAGGPFWALVKIHLLQLLL